MSKYFEEMEKIHTEGRMTECPICGKRFLPSPEHYWKIGTGEYEMETRTHVVCSYSCMRKWEKGQEAKRQARRERARKAREKRSY